MGNKTSRVVAWVMIMAMIAVITACANNGGNQTVTEGNNASSSQNANNGTDSSSESDKVKIKIMGQFASSNLSETDKLLVEAIEKATNTEIEFDIPPSTGYTERVQLMMTTGDYPDAVYFADPRDNAFLNAVRDGIVIPINSYLESAKNVMNHSYDISWDALNVNNDGNIYGIPRTSVIRSDGYWVRKDWLDHFDIAIPDNNEITMEQMTDILRKFSKEDPDRNGVHDTYGYGAHASGDKSMKPIFLNEFSLYGWQETANSDYAYMSDQYDLNSEQYVKALAFTASLYQDGLIDPDAPLIDTNTATERFKSGKTGVLRGFSGHYESMLSDGKKVNPDFELAYVFVKNEQDELKGLGQGTGLFGFWAVTSNASNPQRVVDVFDYMLSDDGWDQIYYGIEGHDYKLDNGQRVYPEKPLDTFIRKNMVRRAEDYMFFINPAMPEDLKQKIVPSIQKAVESMVLSKDRDYTPEIARTPAYLDFEKEFSVITTKIIVGDAPAVEYKNVLQEWYDKFGEAYLTEMNDYIEKMESSKK